MAIFQKIKELLRLKRSDDTFGQGYPAVCLPLWRSEMILLRLLL